MGWDGCRIFGGLRAEIDCNLNSLYGNIAQRNRGHIGTNHRRSDGTGSGNRSSHPCRERIAYNGTDIGSDHGFNYNRVGQCAGVRSESRTDRRALFRG